MNKTGQTDAFLNMDHYLTDGMLIMQFLLFKLSDHLKQFRNHLNPCHVNISFTMKLNSTTKYHSDKSTIFLKRVNLQEIFIENKFLVVCISILIAFYLISTKSVLITYIYKKKKNFGYVITGQFCIRNKQSQR